MDAEHLLTNIAGYTEATRARTSADRPSRWATVAYDHDPAGPHARAPRVQFDGEPSAGQKRYPTLFGYRPQPGDRVLLSAEGARGGYVIVGPLTPPAAEEWLVVKEEDQSVTSSTTLVDDLELWADVEAHATYRIILVTNVTGSTGGDIKLAWSVPSGSDSGGRWLQGPNVGQDPGGAVTMEVRAAVWSTERAYGCSSTANSIIEHGLLRTGSEAGRLQLRWAQNSSSGTATTVSFRSNLWVKRFR